MESHSALLITIGSVAFLIAIVVAVRRMRREDREQPASQIQDPVDTPQPIKPAPDAEPVHPRIVPSVPARKARETALQARETAGLCRYCDAPATHAAPTLRIVQPLFESLLRYLNATTHERWVVETQPAGSRPSCCERHARLLIGLFKKQISAERDTYTQWVNDQHIKMLEFDRWGADEIMLSLTQEQQNRKPMLPRRKRSE